MTEDRDIPDILKYRELIGELFPSLSKREKVEAGVGDERCLLGGDG